MYVSHVCANDLYVKHVFHMAVSYMCFICVFHIYAKIDASVTLSISSTLELLYDETECTTITVCREK